jgi:predicted peptidase
MIRRAVIALVFSIAAGPVLFAQGPPPSSPPPLVPNPAGPMYQQKGEQYRAYNFPVTGESIPYRLFVPSRWTPAARLPLLVTLRAGNTIDGPYRAGNDLVKQAELRGYIVVTPLGYRGLSQPYYGSPHPIVRPNGPSVPAAGWTPLETQRAEEDVMNVIRLVQAEYNTDPGRTYIHGQNPSGSGALYLASRYPDLFAGVVVSSGPIVYDAYPFANIKGKMGLLVIHGDQDANNPIAASQKLAEAAKAAGVDTEYATVPGGTHLEAYLTYARQIFDFLDKHRK